jgi:glycosyltransferase involved in cell wall biosynthesis
VFVQSPPSIAVLIVCLYCWLTGSCYVVDAHSDAFHSAYWSRPAWLHRFLARRAVTTIVTNEHFREMLESWDAHAFVLRDVPTTFPHNGHFAVHGAFNVVVVNTFAADEPLAEVLQAAENMEGVHLYITGKKSRAGSRIPTQYSANVHFTDFLPDEDYYALLNAGDAVMCLTTRDHTMQRGACEALWLGKPIITSDWPLLQSYFHRGTIHVDNSAQGIHEGVAEMAQYHARYQVEIKELQKGQMQEWHDKINSLTDLIEQSLGENRARSEGEMG